MKKSILFFAICLISFLSGRTQAPTLIKLADLAKIINSDNDTTYVINFWATWCVPCVKEFPSFQDFAKAHKGDKMKVVMVSLDFKKDFKKTLTPFIEKHPIAGTVVLLDEPDYNSWINQVSPDWQGEIPVTLIVNNSKKIRTFFNHDFTAQQLEDTFTKTIKQ